jgi:uncharacterized protein YdiU (UPF0061 family)
MASENPFLNLDYDAALEAVGPDYYDIVTAAEFPHQVLRFRNDALLPQIGLPPATVTDGDFIEAFGHFRGREPFLALRYHGYQFGTYNPFLGDGRGFLYGQVRGVDGDLYDFGTKGSGTTPYSRGGDGRLTLKGGVREVLAAEMLHVLGVNTSRCLSLIETGESLWRGDEPSPTRSSVMVRFSRSHLRFGTFERLHHIQRPDLIQKLLNHVIAVYYPHLWDRGDRYGEFYRELVQRTADLVAQWMAAGFCHGVLNTDNMSITGESFDYGPYAFLDRYDPRFTAAYFDYSGRYCYANQPAACVWNLERLQAPLQAVLPQAELADALAAFGDRFTTTYRRLMMQRLGVPQLEDDLAMPLLQATLQLMVDSPISYQGFFLLLRRQVSPLWWQDATLILNEAIADPAAQSAVEFPDPLLQAWRSLYHRALLSDKSGGYASVAAVLHRWNPDISLVRSEIEAVWEPITVDDDWAPFESLLKRIWASVEETATAIV